MADDKKLIQIAYRPSQEKKSMFGNMSKLFQSKPDEAIMLSGPKKIEEAEEAPQKKRRGRPPKRKTINSNEINKDEVSSRKLNPLESNAPYIDSYKENMKELKNTITGIDVMVTQIHRDLQMVRASKTLKRKYDYICQLSDTESGLVGNRISAIREINNAITNAHRLEITRAKETNSVDNQDDDKAIFDMYNAYVNTPFGAVPGAPVMPNLGNIVQSPSLNAIPINSSMEVDSGDAGYNDFLANPSPEMTAIRMEQNPNIKQVVVWNKDTDEKYFDVIDISTGQSIPDAVRPGTFLLQDMQIDERNQCARNIKMNITYPLVIVGTGRLSEY